MHSTSAGHPGVERNLAWQRRGVAILAATTLASVFVFSACSGDDSTSGAPGADSQTPTQAAATSTLSPTETPTPQPTPTLTPTPVPPASITLTNGTALPLKVSLSGDVTKEVTIPGCSDCPQVRFTESFFPQLGVTMRTSNSEDSDRSCGPTAQRTTIEVGRGRYKLELRTQGGELYSHAFEVARGGVETGKACVWVYSDGKPGSVFVGFSDKLPVTPTPVSSTPVPTATAKPDQILKGTTSAGGVVAVYLDAAKNISHVEMDLTIEQNCGAGKAGFILGPQKLKLGVEERPSGSAPFRYTLDGTVLADSRFTAKFISDAVIAVTNGVVRTPYFEGTFAADGKASGTLSLFSGAASISPPEGVIMRQVPGSGTPGHCFVPVQVTWSAGP